MRDTGRDINPRWSRDDSFMGSSELRLAIEVGAQDTGRDINPRWSRDDSSSLKMRDGCAEQLTSTAKRHRAKAIRQYRARRSRWLKSTHRTYSPPFAACDLWPRLFETASLPSSLVSIERYRRRADHHVSYGRCAA